MNRKNQLVLARILIVISCVMMLSGFLYNYKLTGNIINPITDTTRIDDDRTVSITTVDEDEEEVVPEDYIPGEEVVEEPEDDLGSDIERPEDTEESEDTEVKPETEAEQKPSGGTSTTKPSGGSSSSKPSGGSTSGSGGTTSKPSGGSTSGGGTTSKPSTTTPSTTQPSTSTQTQKPSTPLYPTVDETNNSLRVDLQNKYGIVIKYGSETNGYNVGGMSTTSISNAYTVQTALNNLSNSLSLYPNGFFQEIKNGGIPLTLYLIQKYSQSGVTGATDSNLYRATISIAVDYPFADSFHHEVYHYMDRYIEKKGGSYSKWTLYNPQGFEYNRGANSTLSYSVTGNPSSYFVNNYAQTAAAEDRASTFEYMMANSRISCFNPGKPVWNKANHMSEVVDLAFNSVSPNVIEHWERFVLQ